MPILNPNSTNYQHPWEPNLADLHTAMTYDEAGVPHIRVTLGADNITVTGNVNVATDIRINNTEQQSIPVHLTDDPIAVTQSGTWNVGIGTDGTVSLSATTLSALENITVSGSVGVSNFPATQAVTGTFWQATQPVSGTVTIQDGGNTITVDGTVTANVTFPTTQQVSGTVALDTATLTALENTTVTVTGSVVVDNDSSNPLEVNAIISNPDPINVNANITGGTVTIQQAAGEPTLVKYIDSGTNLQMDMVERLRVAQSTQSWWYAPTVDKDGDLRYIESVTGTNAGSIFVQNLSSINLSSGTDANGSMIRISRRRHKMRPGVSMLCAFSVNWNGYVPEGNVTKRVGMFTNYNGVFYEMTDDLQVVVRRRLTDGTLVEKRTTRADFNLDKLDGTGTTGLDLRPVVHLTSAITAYVSKSSVAIPGDGTVYRVVFTVADPTQFYVSQKGRITGVTPALYNGTVMVTAISGSNVTFVYNIDPGSFVSLSSAKFEHSELHNQYLFGFDFGGSRIGRVRFFMDGPAGRTAIHIEDFGSELSTPFANAPAVSTRYEIFNSGAPGRLPNLTVSSEVVNVEAELELNPGFGTAQRSTALAIGKGVRTEYALLGLGLRAGEPYQRADLQLQNIQIIDSGNVNTQNAGVYAYRLILNPSFGGTAVPASSDVGKASRMWAYNNGTTVSGGTTLLSGYLTSTTELDVKTALNFLNLGSNIAYDDADKVVVAIKMLVDGTSDGALLATMNYIEAL